MLVSLRILLSPLSLIYGLVIVIRNMLYTLGWKSIHRLPAFVISVGNITTGGTGKSPVVVALAVWLQSLGFSVGILSRGYKRRTTGTHVVSNGAGLIGDWEDSGDEPAMFALQTKGIPIVVDQNRFHGGQTLIDKFNTKIILLDDAFQHRPVYRDIDLVLVNAGDKRSDHWLIPAGKLREPWKGTSRSSGIVVTKTDSYTPPPFLVKKLDELTLPVFSPRFSTTRRLVSGNETTKPLLLVCGIADPESFQSALRQQGLSIGYEMKYRDHHPYTKRDMEKIKDAMDRFGCGGIICTEKDWVKIASLSPRFPVYTLDLSMEIPEELKRLILSGMEKRN